MQTIGPGKYRTHESWVNNKGIKIGTQKRFKQDLTQTYTPSPADCNYLIIQTAILIAVGMNKKINLILLGLRRAQERLKGEQKNRNLLGLEITMYNFRSFHRERKGYTKLLIDFDTNSLYFSYRLNRQIDIHKKYKFCSIIILKSDMLTHFLFFLCLLVWTQQKIYNNQFSIS